MTVFRVPPAPGPAPPWPWALLAFAVALVSLVWSTAWLFGMTGPIEVGDRNDAVTRTPFSLFVLLMFALVAAWVGLRDRWLGIFVATVVILTAWRPTAAAFQTAGAVTLGAVALTALRALPSSAWRVVQHALAVLGVTQVAYAGLQWVGHDPLWGPYSGGQIHGTVGNPVWFGTWLALVTAVGPRWVWPVGAAGVLLSGSRLAGLAVVVATAWRWRRPAVWGPLGLGVAVAAITTSVVQGPRAFLSLGARLTVWRYLAEDWWRTNPVLGLGPGALYWRGPAIQIIREPATGGVAGGTRLGEWFAQAHNEPLQLVYETGVLGGLCLLAWLWSHRHRWWPATPWTAGVLALAVLSLGMFPFHIPQVATLGIVVLAGATSNEIAGKESQ